MRKKSRTKSQKRVWYDYCINCNKVAYTSPSVADTERKNFVRANKSDRFVKVYKCPDASRWHIASSKPNGK